MAHDGARKIGRRNLRTALRNVAHIRQNRLVTFPSKRLDHWLRALKNYGDQHGFINQRFRCALTPFDNVV